MSLIQQYLGRTDLESYYSPFNSYGYWYVGTENTIKQGLYALFSHLNRKGYIIIGDIEIFDYDVNSGPIIYVILYKALPKLEYLAARAKISK